MGRPPAARVRSPRRWPPTLASRTSIPGCSTALWGDRWRLTAVILTARKTRRSEEHTSELQSLMRISYAVFCLKKKTHNDKVHTTQLHTRLLLTNLHN